MDRKEELQKLKKELFNVQMQIQFNKMKDASTEKLNEREELESIHRKIRKQIATLTREELEGQGQESFGFVDLIDTSKVLDENSKGKGK